MGPDPYVLSMLSRLYPPPLRLQSGRESRPDTLTAFLLLPSHRTRIIVPAGHPRASARAVNRQLTGRRMRTRAARRLLSSALASGLVDLLSSSRLAVSGPSGADSIEEVLVGVLGGSRALFTMPVGPARANRKPVLQVTDLAGEVRAFVKVGHDDLTRALVDAEGRTLRRLDSAALRHVRVPRVLAHEEWRDLAVLVLEPLPVSGAQVSADVARERLLTAMAEICGLSAWRGSWADNPFRSRLKADLVSAGKHGVALLEALHALDATSPEIPLGSWHGDLNPGNVAVLPDQVLIWDWERFSDGVPIGFDLLHHELQRAITVRGMAPDGAARDLLEAAADLLGAFDVAPQTADAIARLYLLTLAARYLGDDQERAGAALGRVADWILPALRSAAGS